jgi:hypothetical protein
MIVLTSGRSLALQSIEPVFIGRIIGKGKSFLAWIWMGLPNDWLGEAHLTAWKSAVFILKLLSPNIYFAIDRWWWHNN